MARIRGSAEGLRGGKIYRNQQYGWWRSSAAMRVGKVAACSEANAPPLTIRGTDRDCPTQRRGCLQRTYNYNTIDS